MGKIAANITFFILFLLSAVSFIFSIDTKNINIPLIENVYKNVYINVETEKQTNDFELFNNENKIAPYIKDEKNHRLIYKIENEPVYKLSYKGKQKNIAVVSGNDIINLDDTEINNSKGKIKNFSTLFLSLFYTPKNYALSFLFLIITIGFYYKNKDKIDIKFNLPKNLAISLIILLGFILRLSDNSLPLWWDELYTVTMTGNPNFPWFTAFLDPNNPPLFYLLSKIWIYIFKCNTSGTEALLRGLPLIFSTLSILALYILVKENISKRHYNKGFALLAAFLFSINLYAIYTAFEYRGYSLLMFLVILSSAFLFKIKEKGFNKHFIYYAITACFLANTHYYGVFILILNFILMMFVLENYKKLKFLYSNLAALISFLPWFIISIFIGNAKEGNFISNLEAGAVFNIFFEMFHSKLLALIVVLVFIIMLLHKRSKQYNLYFYSMYIVLGLIGFCGLLSFIKPCIRDYYFVSVICFIPVILSYIFYLPNKNKLFKSILTAIVFVLYFTGTHYIKRDEARLLNIDLLYKYPISEQNKDKALILTPGISYFGSFYKTDDNIRTEEIETERTSDEIIEKIKTSKNKIFYIKTDIGELKVLIQQLSYKFKIEYIMGDNNIIILKAIKKF